MKKIAICILTRGYKSRFQYADLIRRNRAIYKVIEAPGEDFSIDYLVFHEGNICKSHQDFIARYSNLTDIKFIDVGYEFQSPSNMTSVYCHSTVLSNSFSIGYKAMCRFWSDRFLDYTKEYRYVVRIDEDCIIKNFPLSALIQEMQSSNINYMTPKNFEVDHSDVTIGLLEMAKAFMKSRNIICSDKLSLKLNPYTNLFLLDAKHYREAIVFRDFMKAVHEANGIYINRWGDHVIWGLAMKILGENQIKMVSENIVYIHGSFGEIINRKKTYGTSLEIILNKFIKWSLKNYEKFATRNHPN